MVKVSQRTCIGCRRADRKVFETEGPLVRVVWKEGKPVVDREGKLPGRGAYMHRRLECLLRLGSAKIWERAFRLAAGTVDRGALGKFIEELRRDFLNNSGEDKPELHAPQRGRKMLKFRG